MSEPPSALVAVDLPSGSRRSVRPPWQVVVAFALLVSGEVVNQALTCAHRLSVKPIEVGLCFGSYSLLLVSFWLLLSRAAVGATRSASPARRWFVAIVLPQLVLLCFAPLEFELYIPLLMFGGYGALLFYPFSRLFADLRLDRSQPASSVLVPSTLFFVFALMAPACFANARGQASVLEHWILFVAPCLCVGTLGLHIRKLGSRRAHDAWHLLLCSLPSATVFGLGQLLSSFGRTLD